MASGSAYPAYITGTLCIVGGLIGFVRKHSKSSLVAGVGVGSLYIYGANAILKDAPNGIEAVCAASALLFLSSFTRATLRRIPAMLTLLGVGNGIYYGKAYYALRG